ncbi:MAG: acyl-CoA desaturase, partial [Euryarchaeota archaeon]|nr:acyl-CoA desaturase [Euryarchaeota archaeon]
GHGVNLLALGLLLGFWAFGGLGITLGFHRMLAHQAFSAPAPVRALLLIAGTTALQGPCADWAATHRRHHAKSDRDGDPHSPVEGFLHSHFGWLLRDRFVRTGKTYASIVEDPVVRFVSNTFWVWAGLGLVAPFFIGLAVTGTLAGAWIALLWGTAVRIFISHHLTWAVNSLGHTFGTRPHDTHDRSHNNGFLAIFTWGEGWHNNHHAFPRSPFIGLRWYQVDIGGYVLRLLAWMRLARLEWRVPRGLLKRKTAAAKAA